MSPKEIIMFAPDTGAASSTGGESDATNKPPVVGQTIVDKIAQMQEELAMKGGQDGLGTTTDALYKSD